MTIRWILRITLPPLSSDRPWRGLRPAPGRGGSPDCCRRSAW